MSDHALLSASASSRWLKCTRSARLEEKLPVKDNIYSDEGTLAHDYCANELRYYNKELGDLDYASHLDTIEDHKLYSKDVPYFGDQYVRFVSGYFESLRAKRRSPVLFTEQRIDTSKYIPEGFGTSDNFIVTKNKLIVFDLKFGQGVPVSAVDNTQMLIYALGALEIASMFTDVNEIEMHIIQPRIDNNSKWSVSIDDFMSWVKTILVPTAKRAYRGEGDFVPGPHCRFCRAKSNCKALQQYNSELARFDFNLPEFMSDDDIVEVLTRADMFTNWINSVKAYAEEMALKGKKFPGYKLVAGRSNRVYKDEKKIIQHLRKSGYKDAEILDISLKSITQLESILGRGEFHSLLTHHIIKPRGKPTLVPVTDKRVELNSIEEAINDFKHLKL